MLNSISTTPSSVTMTRTVNVDDLLQRAGYATKTIQRLRRNGGLQKSEPAAKVLKYLEQLASNPKRDKRIDAKRSLVIAELRISDAPSPGAVPASSSSDSSADSAVATPTGAAERRPLRFLSQEAAQRYRLDSAFCAPLVEHSMPSRFEPDRRLGNLYAMLVLHEGRPISIKIGRTTSSIEHRCAELDSETRQHGWKHVPLDVFSGGGCLEARVHAHDLIRPLQKVGMPKEYFQATPEVLWNMYVAVEDAEVRWHDSRASQRQRAERTLGLDAEAQARAHAAADVELELKRAMAAKLRSEALSIDADADVKRAEGELKRAEASKVLSEARAIELEGQARARAIELEGQARARAIDTTAAADADLKRAQASKALQSAPKRAKCARPTLDTFLASRP